MTRAERAKLGAPTVNKGDTYSKTGIAKRQNSTTQSGKRKPGRPAKPKANS